MHIKNSCALPILAKKNGLAQIMVLLACFFHWSARIYVLLNVCAVIDSGEKGRLERAVSSLAHFLPGRPEIPVLVAALISFCCSGTVPPLKRALTGHHVLVVMNEQSREFEPRDKTLCALPAVPTPLVIDKVTVFDKPTFLSGSITIEPTGSIVVDADVTIDTAEIFITSRPHGRHPIQLRSGHLKMQNIKITAKVSDPDELERLSAKQSRKLYEKGPEKWLIYTGKSARGRIEISDSSFRAKDPYFMGGLFVRNGTQVSCRIINNEFCGLHGVIYFGNAGGAEICGNYLFRNSFGNIVGGGARLHIEDNQILFPGNGTSGDGVTLSGVSDSILKRNTIQFGSCYGIWIEKAHNLQISQNNILNTITSALYLAQDCTNITISENVLSQNRSYGIAVEGKVDGLIIDGNILHCNNPAMAEQQIMIQSLIGYTANNNVVFKGHQVGQKQPYGTNVEPIKVRSF